MVPYHFTDFTIYPIPHTRAEGYVWLASCLWTKDMGWTSWINAIVWHHCLKTFNGHYDCTSFFIILTPFLSLLCHCELCSSYWSACVGVCECRLIQAVISGYSTWRCRRTNSQPSVCDMTLTGLSGSQKSRTTTPRHQSAGSMSARSTHSAMSRLQSSSGSSVSVHRTSPSSQLLTARGICTFIINRSRLPLRSTTARLVRRLVLLLGSRWFRWNRPMKYLVFERTIHISLFCVVNYSMQSVLPMRLCSAGWLKKRSFDHTECLKNWHLFKKGNSENLQCVWSPVVKWKVVSHFIV